MKDNSPIFEQNGKWYFWDETGADKCGPFDTEQIAKEKLQEYCVYLNSENCSKCHKL